MTVEFDSGSSGNEALLAEARNRGYSETDEFVYMTGSREVVVLTLAEAIELCGNYMKEDLGSDKLWVMLAKFRRAWEIVSRDTVRLEQGRKLGQQALQDKGLR